MSTYPDSDESERSPSEKLMGFWDHIAELRGTLIKSVLAFVAFAALIGYFIFDIIPLLEHPFAAVRAQYPDQDIKLVTIGMADGLNMAVKVCLFGGLLLAVPFILFFVAQFVAPALTHREKDAVVPMCVAAFFLFVAGAAFGFFVLVPSTVHMFIKTNIALGWPMDAWSITSYYGILTQLVLGLGIAFQFPLVLVLLTWLGIVSVGALRTYRRHAVVAIFVIAAIATPSTEVTAQVIFAAPLCVLYELAILVCARIEKRRERPAALVVVALLALLQRSKSLAHRAANPSLSGVV